MKKLLKSKGFTLVELIVAMAITGLLVAAAMALFGPVQSITNSLNENSNLTTTTDTLTGYLFNKLHKCSTYNVGLYSEAELIAGTDAAGSVTARINTMYSKIADKSSETIRCIMIKPDSVTGKQYVYDFGILVGTNPASDYLSKYTDMNKYKLFSDEYYDDIDYRFTFKTTPSEAVAGVRKWCRIGVTPYDNDGNAVMEERSQMFKLVNMDMTGLTPSSAAELEALGYDSDGTIIILYQIKNFALIS